MVELAHERRPIGVKVHTRLDGTPFAARWLEITNTGSESAALATVAPWSGLLWFAPDYHQRLPHADDAPFTVGYSQRMGFGHEGDFVWERLRTGTSIMQGRMGHSGWGLPFFITRNEVTGESVVMHLAWSGNWAMEFLVETERYPVDQGLQTPEQARFDSFVREGPPPNAALFFKFSPVATAPQRIIAPGETVITPAVHLGLLQADLDGCVQALHEHLRRSVLRPQIPERTLLIGAGRVVEGDLAWMKHEIDLAAEIGCDYFMVDAGWYGMKPYSWSTTVGDWNVGSWLPQGLQGLRDYIHGKGMLFGLWMEPESVGGDSVLAREHPEWVLRRDGEPVAGGRALDLSRPEVARWVGDEVLRVIREHGVDHFKLDFNTHVREGGEREEGGRTENTLWRHVEAIYDVFDRVRDEFPDVLLENCASGGARNDIGMLSRFHVCSMSDWSSPPRSLKALNNLTLALPPEQLRYYFGHYNDGIHNSGDLTFQWHMALFANPLFIGLAPSLADLNPPLLALYRRYIDLYKRFMRPLLPTCRVFHHTPALPLASTPPWCVLEYASPDGLRAYAGVFRLSSTGDPVYSFHPRGLDLDRRYRITHDRRGGTTEMTGDAAMRNGLPIRLETGMTSELLLFERCDD